MLILFLKFTVMTLFILMIGYSLLLVNIQRFVILNMGCLRNKHRWMYK